MACDLLHCTDSSIYIITSQYLSISVLPHPSHWKFLPPPCPWPNTLQDPTISLPTKWYISHHKYRQYHKWGIMANMVLCVISGQGNSKILNLVKSGSFDSPIFLYIPNDEKTSTGHLIWPQPFIWQPFLEISCPGMTLWVYTQYLGLENVISCYILLVLALL
jgi:hypothetical protein